MKRGLEIRAEASRHIAEALSWYEAQRQGLGWTFRDKLDNALKLLLEHPEAGPEVYRGLRRVLVDHFPYAVYLFSPQESHRHSGGPAHATTPSTVENARRA